MSTEEILFILMKRDIQNILGKPINSPIILLEWLQNKLLDEFEKKYKEMTKAVDLVKALKKIKIAEKTQIEQYIKDIEKLIEKIKKLIKSKSLSRSKAVNQVEIDRIKKKAEELLNKTKDLEKQLKQILKDLSKAIQELHEIEEKLENARREIIEAEEKICEIRTESAEEIVNFFIELFPELKEKINEMNTVFKKVLSNEEVRDLCKEASSKNFENSESAIKKFKEACVKEFRNINENEVASKFEQTRPDKFITAMKSVDNCCTKEEPWQKQETKATEEISDLKPQVEEKKTELHSLRKTGNEIIDAFENKISNAKAEFEALFKEVEKLDELNNNNTLSQNKKPPSSPSGPTI